MKKKKLIRRIVSIMLIISLALSTLPLEALAVARNGTTPVSALQQAIQNPFNDVSKADWFYDAVKYAKQNGIMGGTGTDTFSPDGIVTRAMYVTILGRMIGVDESKYSASAFSDVKRGIWYAPYVEWASQKGITAGIGGGKFSPDSTITREQMATLTVRYFDCYGVSYETGMNKTSQPKDLSAISPWARDAVVKLWQAGLIQGYADGSFNPQAKVTRAEVSVFGMRTSETVKTGSKTEQPVDNGSSSHDLYTITFDTNGGNPIASQTLYKGKLLNDLPIPYKMNAIFLGWYKDSSLSDPISGTDTLTGNLTLHAKYSNGAAIEETESVPFVSKLDVAQNFTIAVSDSSGLMTAEQVKAAMTFKCLSNPDFAGIEVTGSAGQFTVAAQGGAFEAGATCKLTLNDKKLSFTGEEPSTTIYNFTIAMPEVMNLSLNGGIIYIPASQVSDMTKNGGSVATLSVPVASVGTGGTDLSTVELSHGTFTYGGDALKVGDNIAIYEGTRPDQRNLETSEADQGAVAYVAITGVDGNTYTYKNSDSKEVLFTPDILPVSESADTDGDPNDHSITVSKSDMTYIDSEYAQLGLGADTSVDVGDFMAFYSGAFGPGATLDGYERITGVSSTGGTYVITYTDVTKDQMIAVMDLCSKKNVDGEKLLQNTNVAALQTQIEQQAVASGFVDNAAGYLTALALETNNFKTLDNNFKLKNYNIELPNGKSLSAGQVKLMGGKRVEMKNLSVHARLDTQLEHFKSLSGVRCALEVGFDIVIDAGKCDIVIHVSGTFEQEVRLVVKANGGAVWKYWWIFPYIADYRLNASIDAYSYTGIRVSASVGTFEKEEEWDWDDSSKVQNIAKQIKELMDKKDQYIGDGINTVAGSLADKYKNMLGTDSDWIDLINKDIASSEGSIDPFKILVYGVKVSFVVTANMNLSIGCDFYYENAKRHIYSLGLFSRTSKSDTVSLVPERYQFTFYIMGTLGLRAGIRLEISVGLFDLKLDSVGIVAEVGAYLRLWGYFYYELTYTELVGKTSQYSGALYIEMGIYLEIKFRAQLFNGTFEYMPTLYENEWPLWFAGSQQNIYDFSYSDADTPAVSIAKQVTTFVLPDSTFSMNYMDMKTGETDKKTYDDSKDFTIKMTNSDFSYDTAANTITVMPGTKLIEDGKMMVTWNSAPLALTSQPISRTISLHWENLKDTYSISFNSNGGSAVNTIALPYNSAVAAPANPQKDGYLFDGWYRDQNCTQAYTMPAAMPTEDVLLFAKWTPDTNTKYTVEHYQQNIVNDLYTLADTDSLTGTTNTTVSPECKSYQGFTAPAVQSLEIQADGSAVLRYYYTRNSYSLTFDANGGTRDSTTQVKYGASISAPVVTRTGYTFGGWSTTVASVMPAQNTTYTADWMDPSNTRFKVEHYQQDSGAATYTLLETENLSGPAATTASATPKNYPGFAYDSSVPGTVASGNIAPDGSLVLKLYYTRNSYTITYKLEGSADTVATLAYGANITPLDPAPPAGLVFYGWKTDTTYARVYFLPSTMPANNLVVYGKYITNSNPPDTTIGLDFTNVADDWRGAGNLAGVIWNNSTKTLTLINTNLVGANTTGIDSFALRLPTGSTLVLHGANTLTGGTTQTAQSSGVLCDGDLTIEGDGSLTSIAGSDAVGSNGNCISIYAAGNISSSADVTAQGGWAQNASCGVFGNSFTVTGGTASFTGGTADSNSFGIYTGDLSISGGTVNFTGGNALLCSGGIYATGTTNLSGGDTTVTGLSSAMFIAPALSGTTVTVASPNADGSSPTGYDPASITNYKYLEIQPQ